MQNIILFIVLGAAVAYAIYSIVKNVKGKNGCNCGCNCNCTQQKETNDKNCGCNCH